MKMRKKFCTCKIFSILQKCRKNAQNAKKKCDFWAFFLNKKRVFHSAIITKMLSKSLGSFIKAGEPVSLKKISIFSPSN